MAERSAEEKAMILSGVGRSYINKSMKGYPMAQPVIDYLAEGTYKADLLKGRGLILYGKMPDTDAILHLCARSAIGREVSSVVIDTEDLYEAMVRGTADAETLARIQRSAAIFIPSFVVSGYEDGKPYGKREQFALERVISTFLDEERAVTVAIEKPVSEWWSSGLAGRLKAHNKELIL